MENRIEDQIKEMMVERLFLRVKPDEISDGENLGEEIGVDSVQLFEIIVGLEEIFGISVEDEEFDQDRFRSVKSIADFVRSKQ